MTESNALKYERSTKKISRSWSPFIDRLTAVLARLEEDHYLVISAKRSNRYVQFAGQGAWGMRVEATSNQFLKKDERLGRRQMACLKAKGWSAPTGSPAASTPARDPDGSPNFFIDFAAPVDVSEVARLAVATLIDAFELPYPGALEYEAFDADGKPLAFPDLGLKPATSTHGDGQDVAGQILTVFREVTGIADLALDEDGDASVNYGAISVCAIQLGNNIRMFSALVSKMAESPELLRKLNAINDGAHRLRCFLHEGVVYAVVDVPAQPFVATHLATALREFGEVAEGLAIVLRAEFAGQAVVDWNGVVPTLQ